LRLDNVVPLVRSALLRCAFRAPWWHWHQMVTCWSGEGLEVSLVYRLQRV